MSPESAIALITAAPDMTVAYTKAAVRGIEYDTQHIFESAAAALRVTRTWSFAPDANDTASSVYTDHSDEVTEL